MAETLKTIDQAMSELLNMQWYFDDRFAPCFLLPEESAKQIANVSLLRSKKAITIDSRLAINELIKLGESRYRDFIIKITNQPRVDAQKFIIKKNIRSLIFNRDSNKCLRCGSDLKLSLDHIIPINRNGLNRIMNLQTLCCSCNSWKSDRSIDFRPGARVPSKYLKSKQN